MESRVPRSERGEQEADQVKFVVLGMHRSGTSALTRLFNHVGIAGPRTPIRPSKNNERGYGESRRIAELNERNLQQLGATWRDPKRLNWRDLGTERLESLQKDCWKLFQEEYPSPVIALKDPRIARLGKIWKPILQAHSADTHWVFIFRNPLEVIDSIKERNGLAPSSGELLWLRYNIDAWRDYGAEIRAVCNYGYLFSNWRETLADIEKRLCVQWPSEPTQLAHEGLNPIVHRLRHHAYSSADVANDPHLSPWTKDLYAALLAAARGEKSYRDTQELIAVIDEELNSAERLYADVVAEKKTALSRMSAEHETRVKQLEVCHAREKEELGRRIAGLEIELAASQGRERELIEQARAATAASERHQKELQFVTDWVLERVRSYERRLQEQARIRTRYLKLKERYAQLEQHYIKLVRERSLILRPLGALAPLLPRSLKEKTTSIAKRVRGD